MSTFCFSLLSFFALTYIYSTFFFLIFTTLCWQHFAQLLFNFSYFSLNFPFLRLTECAGMRQDLRYIYSPKCPYACMCRRVAACPTVMAFIVLDQ